MATLDPDMDSFDKLMYLNREMFLMIENTISLDLLARLYSTQLITTGEKHLLDRNRIYYRLLRRIAQEGQDRGQLTSEVPAGEIARIYAMCERGLLYDWCIREGEYSLSAYAQRMMPMFLGGLRANKHNSV